MQRAYLMSLPLLLLGCRSVELNFAVAGGSGLTFERAEARIDGYTLTDCDGEAFERRVRWGLDLLDPRPISVRDGEQCQLKVEFRDRADALQLSGVTDEGTPFSIELDPGTIAVNERFGGEREELVLLLDTDALFTGSSLDNQAQLSGYADVTADSPLGQEWSLVFGRALSVTPLASAQLRGDWLVGSALSAPPSDEGCAGGDTGRRRWDEEDTWQRDTDSSGAGSGDSGRGGGGGCGAKEDGGEAEEDRGGGCDGGDTGGEGSDEEDSAEEEDKGGFCGGESDTGARLGAAALALLAWRLRRSRGR